MSNAFSVFAVDDDEMLLDSIAFLLCAEYRVATFKSAEECLLRLATEKPDMFLLDVSMPGIDGYELCRRIKADDELRHIPVTFVSGNDSIEARLCGYDAGGQDFIVKPFAPDELKRKIKVAQQLIEDRLSRDAQTKDARYLASLVMANMDETGYLLAFMRNLVACESDRDVATGLLELAQKYGLEAIVQTRVGQRHSTISAAGTDIPLEVSIADHVRELDRIFEFRQRGVYNFKYVSLIINNMPLHDPDFCGRLRDNLCIGVEAADTSLRLVESEEARAHTQAEIRNAVHGIRKSIEDFQDAHKRERLAVSELMFTTDQSLLRSFVNLGLLASQEEYVSDLFNGFMQQLLAIFDRGEATSQSLQLVIEQLAGTDSTHKKA
jgi:CheY-like chemotaxis protein